MKMKFKLFETVDGKSVMIDLEKIVAIEPWNGDETKVITLNSSTQGIFLLKISFEKMASYLTSH
jgi:hypothetical protein